MIAGIAGRPFEFFLTSRDSFGNTQNNPVYAQSDEYLVEFVSLNDTRAEVFQEITPEGNGAFGPQAASPSTEAAIDAEVQRVVEAAYDKCYATLTEHQALLESLTEGMLEHETLDYQQLEQMTVDHLARHNGATADAADTVAA